MVDCTLNKRAHLQRESGWILRGQRGFRERRHFEEGTTAASTTTTPTLPVGTQSTATNQPTSRKCQTAMFTV